MAEIEPAGADGGIARSESDLIARGRGGTPEVGPEAPTGAIGVTRGGIALRNRNERFVVAKANRQPAALRSRTGARSTPTDPDDAIHRRATSDAPLLDADRHRREIDRRRLIVARECRHAVLMRAAGKLLHLP